MRGFILILALAIASPLCAQTVSPGYRIAHTYVFTGDGGWRDIVPDPPNHRLFISRQDRVTVVDENTGTVLGEVIDVAGARGTAIASASGHGFTTSGQDGSVVMFDLQTFKVLKRIPTAGNASVVYDGMSNRVFAFDGDARSSTVIDPQEGTIVATIALGGQPQSSVSSDDGTIYANLADVSEIVEIDAGAATVTRRWSTAPCVQPVALSIDTVHRRLFSGCRSGVLAVSDYPAGRVVATVPIGPGVEGSGFDVRTGYAFASASDGTLTVIHQDLPDRYHVVQTVQTPRGAPNMGLDPASHRLFLASSRGGTTPAGAEDEVAQLVPESFHLLVIEHARTVR